MSPLLMDGAAPAVAMPPPAPSEPLSIRVLHAFPDDGPLRLAWNQLVLRSGADIYQTYDWCRLWWQHYGANRQLHLLLCFSGEHLVGVVPAFIETLWLGLGRIRVAKSVGADFTLNLCNLPVDRAALPRVISRAIQHFLGRHRCDLFLIGPLSGPAAHLEAITEAARRETQLVDQVEPLGDSPNTYFALPPTFPKYLNDIGKQQRGNLNRCLAQLSKERAITFDVVSQSGQLAGEFESFRRLHAAQWRAEGKPGHFGDWPGAERYASDLIHTLGAQGLVRFYRILAGDQVLSSQFSFAFGGTNYWRLPARICGPEWDRLSLGRMGLAKMIEASIGEGARSIEAGRGHYAYKLQLGGREEPLRTLQVVRRGPGVVTRVFLFKAAAALLDLVYYKVLFARLAPRLPALQRPLLPIWIRSTW